VTGRLVEVLVEGYLISGHYERTFDGTDLASGVYFVKFEQQSAGTLLHDARKVMLVK